MGRHTLRAAAVALAVGACGDGLMRTEHRRAAVDGSGGGGAADLLAGADCDPMVPTQCGFPFPSSVWLVDDASTVTKKRVRFGKTTLPEMLGVGRIDAELFGAADGFSSGQAPMTHLPGATITGLPSQDGIGASLDKDSPTILIEADTGAPAPHFTELDANAEGVGEGAFMLRPVVRLKDATRYIAAIRNVVGANGVALAPHPVFQALRDGTESADPTVASRRALYADILSRLTEAGYPTADLQMAWDYTTASRENNTRRLLHMRDDALAKVGALGPEYAVTNVEEDPNPYIRRRITLKMKVPLYLDKPGAGGKLFYGDDGLPRQNGTAEYEVLVHVPHSVTKGRPGPPLQNGHGLLGGKGEGKNGYLARTAEEGGFVAFGVDFIGMADEDTETIQVAIVSDFRVWEHVIDRQHQGLVNSLLAMRLMRGRFVDDPSVQFDGKSAIDPSKAFYRGDSQGGIYGGTYMAITTDVERGLLGEPGMPYNLLLNRSVDFDAFFIILKANFATMRDVQIVLGLAQMVWDRTEPSGYFPHLTENRLAGTPPHHVLIHVAIGDHQVTPLGAHLMARSVGAKLIDPNPREVWGLEKTRAPYQGSAIVEFDFGLPQLPKQNIAPPPDRFPEDKDPHDRVRVLDAAVAQTITWLHEGKVVQTCAGPCDPE